MTPDLHGLISQMAAELDRCQQLLLDDRRQRHPLAAHARAAYAAADWAASPPTPYPPPRPPMTSNARAALARWGNHPGSPDSSDGPAVPDGREPASVAMQPSDEEIMGLMPQQMHDDLAAAVRAMTEQEGIDSTPAKGVLRIILNRHVVDLVRAALARWGRQPAPPADGDYREAWDMSSKGGSLCFASAILSRLVGVDVLDDADLQWLAAYLQANSTPQPVAVSERPQGWHMLCDIEPEPGTMCDWVIMAQWGCDHGNGEWRHFDGSGVHGKGFAGKRGLMVSDPKLTAWRARPLPTTESQP